MKKSVMIAGIIVTTAITPICATLYADHILEKTYQRPTFGILKNRKVINKNLNFLGGTVHWTAEVSNPCQANTTVILAGTDHIKKTFTGYDIQSTISTDWHKMSALPPAQQKVMAKFILLDAQHRINWLGQVHTSISTKKIEQKDNTTYLLVEPMRMEFDIIKNKGAYDIKNTQIHIPKIYLTHQNQVLFNLQNASSVDSGEVGFSQGHSKIHIEHLESHLQPVIKTKLPNTILKGLTATHNIIEHDKILDMDFAIELQSLQIPQAVKPLHISPLKLNMQFKDIDKTSANNIYDVHFSSSYQCFSDSTKQNLIRKDVEQLLRTGFTVNSKNNHIVINQQPVFKMEMDYHVPANQAQTPQQFYDAVFKTAKYNVDIQIDKSMIESMAYFVLPSHQINQNTIQTMSQSFAQHIGGKVQGQAIIINKRNP